MKKFAAKNKKECNMQDFDFDLPQQQIAQYPCSKRSDSKMLVLDKNSGRVDHRSFADIIGFLKKGDVLVLNDTKVIPTRLIGRKENTDAQVEIFVLDRIDEVSFWGLVKPLKRVRSGQLISFGDGSLKAVVETQSSSDGDLKQIVRFQCSHSDVLDKIKLFGKVPLPPYIKREPDGADKQRYQTVYAKNDGAVAAPTAGLHFTLELLNKIREKGVQIVYVTLHVGYGTFKPVTDRDIDSGKLDFEYYEISEETADKINAAKRSLRRVIAVGTTSIRAIESAAYYDDAVSGFSVKACSAKTDLFIYPGYDFKIADALVTNFHLPMSSLFMLVCAYAGTDVVKNAYAKAVAYGYRFYSYGDSMFIY